MPDMTLTSVYRSIPSNPMQVERFKEKPGDSCKNIIRIHQFDLSLTHKRDYCSSTCPTININQTVP